MDDIEKAIAMMEKAKWNGSALGRAMISDDSTDNIFRSELAASDEKLYV